MNRAWMLGVAAAAAAATLSTGAQAQIERLADGRCFDKGALEFVPCPSEPEIIVAPIIEQVLPREYDWTGFYLGLSAGYVDGMVDGVFDSSAGAGADLLDLGEIDLGGYALGGHIGYLHQYPSDVVVGVELDAAWVNSGDDVDNADVAGAFVEFGGADVNYTASARLRLGYAFDRILPYATGGVALLGYEAYVRDDAGVTDAGRPNEATADETLIVGVIGGGLEFGVTETITLRGEGLYYFVDDHLDASGVDDGDAGDGLDLDGFYTIRGAVSLRF